LRRDFTQAERALAGLPQTPDVQLDRGVVRMEQSRCGEALEYFDRVLFGDPSNLQALFNRGLCLKQLRLPFAAEQALRPVASSTAGGWSQEATVEEQRLERTRAEFAPESKSGPAGLDGLLVSQVPLPEAFITSRPSTARTFYYHAVSSASSGPDLERLRSTARALDQAFGGKEMERRLDRVLKQVRPAREAVALQYRN